MERSRGGQGYVRCLVEIQSVKYFKERLDTASWALYLLLTKAEIARGQLNVRRKRCEQIRDLENRVDLAVANRQHQLRLHMCGGQHVLL